MDIDSSDELRRSIGVGGLSQNDKKFKKKRRAAMLTWGVIITVVSLGVFWVLHTKWGKSLFGVFWFTGMASVFSWLWVPILIGFAFWGFARIDRTVATQTQKYKASNPAPVVDTDKVVSWWDNLWNGGFGGSDSGSGDNSNYTDPGGDGSDSDGSDSGGSGGDSYVVTTYELVPEAATLWKARFVVAVGGSLNPEVAPIVNASFFPAESTVNFYCKSCWWNIEMNEQWKLCMIPKEDWVGQVCIEINGRIARNMGVGVDRDKMNTFNGTGSWKSLCPNCVVAKETVVTPDPNAAVNPPADESSDTANPPAGQQTITGPGTYVVLDPTGSDTRKAVNGVCDGSGAGAGNIKYGTSVTIKQIFPGAGKFSYNGSQDLALTDDGRCLYVGTLLPFK